jgi:rubredoxin
MFAEADPFGLECSACHYRFESSQGEKLRNDVIAHLWSHTSSEEDVRDYRIVAEPGGVKTKCPLCELVLAGESPDEVSDLLHEHLAKQHPKEDEDKAAALVVRETSGKA